VVGDALELAGARVEVEAVLARDAEFLGGAGRPEGGAEDPRDDEPEPVDVVVALDHVASDVVVVFDQCSHRVLEHRLGDQAHPRDGVDDRQLRGIEEVLNDHAVGGLLEGLRRRPAPGSHFGSRDAGRS